MYADPAARDGLLQQLRAQRRLVAFELALRRRDGRIVTVLADVVGEFDERASLVKTRGFLTDRTGQKDLEERLRQAQRLEAVGQLAGGIAHDFNNLLTVIIGCADLLKVENGNVSPVVGGHDSLDELMKAAKRAASLTQQLLAFSRRQVLQPRLLQLNDSLRAVHSMLRRLVPPRVVLVLDLDPRIERVQVDPGQLDQVVVNLVVNSVDAMPRGRNDYREHRERRADGDRRRAVSVRGSRTLCRADGEGHGRRHGRGDVRTGVRAVLHHQARRERHRPRSVDGLWHREAERRIRLDHEQARRRDRGQDLPAGRRRNRPVSIIRLKPDPTS